jgi:hypothetical protein
MGGVGITVGERRGAYRVFMVKLEGKRLLGRLRHGWGDSINL